MSGAGRHLAFLCPRYAGAAGAGGAETLIKSLAQRSAKAGYRVTFLTTCAVDHFSWKNVLPPGSRIEDGLEVRFFPVDEGRDEAAFHAAQDRLCRQASIPPDVEAQWFRHGVHSSALLTHLREEGGQYDRILAGPYLFGLVIAAAQQSPDRTWLIPCLHDEPFTRLSVIREMMARVRGCLFNSEPEQRLAGRIFGFDPRRGVVVGMGLEPFEVDPAAFAARHKLHAPYVMYAGRREPAKSTPLLADYLDAFRKRTGQDVRFVCCGSGPFEQRSFVKDLGFVTEREKHEAMAGATAFIHPSRFESLGIVLLESFLAGTPGLVSSQSEVLRWQCARSGAGLWWRGYPDFEEELMCLLSDRDLRDRMGRQGRDFVRSEYAWEAVDRRLFEALDRG